MSEAAAKLLDLTMRMHGGTPSPEATTIADSLLDGIARLLDEELDGGCPDCQVDDVGEHDALVWEIVESFMARYHATIAKNPKCRAFVYNMILQRATRLHNNPSAWR